MRFSEAAKALENGKKIYSEDHDKNVYFFLNDKRKVVESSRGGQFTFSYKDFNYEWEIWPEPKESNKVTFYECIFFSEIWPEALVWRTQRKIDTTPNWYKKTGNTKEVELLND